jgi:acyl carrier protein
VNDSTEARALAGIRAAFRRIAPEIDLDAIDPAADLREEADLDSVDAINLIVLLDERLGVEIPEADLDEIATLEGMIRYVASRLPPES